VICSAHSQEFVDDFGRKVRNIVADPRHRATFPRSKMSEDSASASRFDTLAGGSYFAVGRGGALTGRGADLLVIDDPIKGPEEASSPAIRKQLKDWFSSVAYTRLTPEGAIVIIRTRWTLDDLAGWIQREHADEDWTVNS